MLAKKRAGGAVPEQEISRREPSESCLLSFSQQRFWFLDQMDPGSASYNIHFPVHLAGSLNVTALEASLNEIVRRHEILRTSYHATDGRPLQTVLPMRRLSLLSLDLGGLPESERWPHIHRLVREQSREPFDLAKGQVFRVTLLRNSDQEHVILLVMHHIVFDGWSSGVFMRELSQLYEAFSNDKPSPLPELPIQYADYAVWQRKRLQGKMLDGLLSYWKGQLENKLDTLELPVDREPPAIQTGRGAYKPFLILPDTTKSLKELSRRQEITPFMALLAAFQTLLYRYNGQNHIAVGSPVANRDRTETGQLIGCFINTILLCTDMSGNPTFEELLARVRDVTLGAFIHQELPFEILVDALQPERQMNYTPLFRVWFVLQNSLGQPFELGDLTMSHVWMDEGATQFDLVLSLVDAHTHIEGCWHYNLDIFDASTLDEIQEHFSILLKAVIAKPGIRLLDIPLADDHQPSLGEAVSGQETPSEEEFTL